MTDTKINNYWNKALQVLKGEVLVLNYETWIVTLRPTGIDGNIFYLNVYNSVHLQSVKRYHKLIQDALNISNHTNYIVEFKNDTDFPEKGTENDISDKDDLPVHSSILNQKYTFDSFVIGNSNRFAHAGAVAVAESPGLNYNPLYIYGGSGLGKTHLMHAIGNQILANNPRLRVLYVTSEKFTNEMIDSISNSKNSEFRAKYRTIDVLMIDDIQFIAGKVGVQEEFFHTFNTLHAAEKQIIISSDRPPHEINTLEERLQTRFKWGLQTDIIPPDLETRIAILKKKAMYENIVVPDDILLFIANNANSNIRELEGALNKLIAYCSLTDNDLTMDIAEKALSDIITTQTREITINHIINAVARYFDITIEDLKGKKKNREIAFPRQIAMYLCREMTDKSYNSIKKDFSRDHTTIMFACDKIKKEIKINNETSIAVDKIKSYLLGK